MLVSKREVKQTSKKLLSVLLAVMMLMTSMSVCFGTIASAAGGNPTDAQWNTLVAALKFDSVKNASFSGEANNYEVDDPDGKVLAAVEAYWSVFGTLANKTPASGNPNNTSNSTGSSEGNRTINQVNDTIKTQLSSRMGADYTTYGVANFITNLISGANVSASTGATQTVGGSSDTSNNKNVPATNLGPVADVNLTVVSSSAITGYTLDTLPDSVVTEKTFTVKHANDRYDYTYATGSTGGCNPQTTYTRTYKYFYYISTTSTEDGAATNTATIKTSAETLESYASYFTADLATLVSKGSSDLAATKTAVNTAKNNVVNNFSGTIYNHFFSNYNVEALNANIDNAQSVISYAPIAREIKDLAATDYSAYGYDRLVNLYNTLSEKINNYNPGTVAADYIAKTENFDLAAAQTVLAEIDHRIEVIEITELKAQIDADMATYNAYTVEGVDTGDVTTSMIGAAISVIAGHQVALGKFIQAYVVEVCGEGYVQTVNDCANHLNYLASVAGYNDRFAAMYAQYVAAVYTATDPTADSVTLREGLIAYTDWYAGLEALIAEMATVLGEEVANALFDDLNTVMLEHRAAAYTALQTRVETQINDAYVLFKNFIDTYGENGQITMANVSIYNAMKNSIGLVDVDSMNYLNGTANDITADAKAKYAEMQREFPSYQTFLDSHGFATFETVTVPDIERPDTEEDIARENENGVYKTSDAEIEKIIGLLDGLLKNTEIKKLLGDLINKDEDGNPTGEPFDLAGLINGLLEESVFTDSLINTIVQYVYPLVCKEFAKVWAGLPPSITIEDVPAGIGSLTADVTAALSLDTVEKAIASVGVYLAPTTLADNLRAKYPAYTDVISVLSSATTKAVYSLNGDGDEDDTFVNPWEDAKLFENVYDEETGEQVFNDDGTPKQVYKLNWGVDEATDKRAAFVDAACAALSGLEPLLLALITNKLGTNANDSDAVPRGSKIGTGSGSAKVSIVNLDLKIDPITLVLQFGANDGWDNALAPIFEALGLENIPHSEDLQTTRKLLENGLLAMVDQLIAKLSDAPVTFLLDALPNLAYALEGGLVAPLLNMLKTEINYYADAKYSVYAYITTIDGEMPQAMKSEEPILINIGEMINLADMGLDISSFQAIWNMIAGGVELLSGMPAPNAGYLASLGTLVEQDTNRSVKTYNHGSANKAYHIEANKADVLVYLLQYVLNSGLIGGIAGESTEGVLADILANLSNNPDIIIAALVELLNQKEYDTLRSYEWFNGVIDGETVVGNSAYEIYMNPNNDWTKEKADYLYNNLESLLVSIFTMAGLDLDKEAEGQQTDLGAFLGDAIDGLLSDKTLTALAALLAKLDLNALLAGSGEEAEGEETPDAPEIVAEGEDAEAAAPAIDVNALVKALLGIDLAAVAAEYADIAAAKEADENYVADFGVDAGTKTFAAALNEMVAPLAMVLDFILAGENLTITLSDNEKVELIGYNGYNNAIIPLLEALGCNVTASADLGETTELVAVLDSLTAKIAEIEKAPVKTIIDMLPGLLYFIASDGVSVTVRNLLQPVYVILDTIRPIIDVDLNELINGLLPEGTSINIDDIGVDTIFDLIPALVPDFDLDISGLEDVIYDVCDITATAYTSKSTLQTEWKKGAYSADFDQADLLTVVLSFVLEWATVEENAVALDELLGTNGIISALDTVFADIEITYGEPNWAYWFETEEEFLSYANGETALPNTLASIDWNAIEGNNDWDRDVALYFSNNLGSLVDSIIGMINKDKVGENGKALPVTLSALLNGVVNDNLGEYFTDEMINEIIGMLKEVLANVDDALLDVGYELLNVDLVGLKNYTCEKDITTLADFAAELGTILDTYAQGLIDLLFFGDDIRLAKKSDNTDTIVINGGLGYDKGLALILEALGCALPEKDENGKVTATAVLGALVDRVNAILTDPINEIIELLPNLIYFLNANGAGVAVDNLLQPVYALLDKINGLGILAEPINLADLLKITKEDGTEIAIDLANLSLENVVTIVEGATGLPLDAAEAILVDFCTGKITEGEYIYKMSATKEDVITILFVVALELIYDDAFTANLNEMVGVDFIDDIKGIIEGAEIDYVAPDWDYALTGEGEYMLGYTNNWNEATAEYVAYTLPAIGDLVAGLVDSNYDSLDALLKDKVNVFTTETLEGLLNMIADFLGGIDAKLLEVGAILDVDLNGLLAHEVAADIDTAEEFAAELANILNKYAKGVVEWLLLGRDFNLIVKDADLIGEGLVTDGSYITIKGAHGYAEGLALLLEALGCENLPDAYAENVTTEAVVTGVLTSLGARIDAILAKPVEEVMNLLPNLLYFLNTNGVAAVIKNTTEAVMAIVEKLGVFGLELDINELVNLKSLMGIENTDATISLDNLTIASLLEAVSLMTGLNLEVVESVLVGFDLCDIAEYDSVSTQVGTPKKMIYSDKFEKKDTVTVLVNLVVLTIADKNNAEFVKELVGEDAYALIENLCVNGVVPADIQEFDWKLTEKADSGEVFSALATSELFESGKYGPLYTEEMANYIANNFGEFVDNIIYLLGIQIIEGQNVDSLKDLINDLLGGSLYNSANVIAIRDALAGVLAGIEDLEVNGKKVGGLIADVLKNAKVADIAAVADVEVPEFSEDRALFVQYLCDVLEPLYPVLEWVLSDKDIAFFAKPDSTDLVKLEGGEGYAYGIIPVLEVLECQNILAPDAYYAAVEANGDVVITSILDPLLNRVDEIINGDPAQEILDMLPNLIYFINSNGVDTVVKNALHAVYGLLSAIAPIAEIDLYELIGIDLAEINFEWLFNKLLEVIADATGYEFSTLDVNAIAELTVGKLESYNSLSGKLAYKMVYTEGESGNKAEMATIVMRLVVTFIMHENNREILIGLLKDYASMNADAEKYVRGILDTFATIYTETYLGMDQALATLYYIFYGADLGVGEVAGGLKDLNAQWQQILADLGKSEDPDELTIGNLLSKFLDKYMDDVLTSDGVAPNGFIAFFQKIVDWFNKIIEWFKGLFD